MYNDFSFIILTFKPHEIRRRTNWEGEGSIEVGEEKDKTMGQTKIQHIVWFNL